MDNDFIESLKGMGGRSIADGAWTSPDRELVEKIWSTRTFEAREGEYLVRFDEHWGLTNFHRPVMFSSDLSEEIAQHFAQTRGCGLNPPEQTSKRASTPPDPPLAHPAPESITTLVTSAGVLASTIFGALTARFAWAKEKREARREELDYRRATAEVEQVELTNKKLRKELEEKPVDPHTPES